MNDEFVLNEMFCCPVLQDMVERGGQRGIAALVWNTGEGLTFVWQSRGIAFDDESKIRPTPGAPDLKVNISCTSGLGYCPACGRRLQELIEMCPAAYEELAQKHQKFLARDMS